MARNGHGERVGVVRSSVFRAHRADGPHPERPERLDAAEEGLSASEVETVELPVREATADELARVHSPDHVDRVLDALSAGTGGYLDPDTYFSAGSRRAALAAAGGTTDLVSRVFAGDLDWGVALPRPPGHHATRDRAMGFCLFNNVAVAAAAALEGEQGARRVFVLDWDVHHGNGTQDIFWSDPRVLYASIHQYPLYPGSGHYREMGAAEGLGRTVNVPLPRNSGDAEYDAAMREVIEPVAEAFAPDLVLVSAGFDAHASDPLASMRVTEAGYGRMAARVRTLADRTANGRVVLVLEGGYDLPALRDSLKASLEAMANRGAAEPAPGAGAGAIDPPAAAAVLDLLGEVRRTLRPHWRGL